MKSELKVQRRITKCILIHANLSLSLRKAVADVVDEREEMVWVSATYVNLCPYLISYALSWQMLQHFIRLEVINSGSTVLKRVDSAQLNTMKLR